MKPVTNSTITALPPQQAIIDYFAHELQFLLQCAARKGVVVRVDLVPGAPLAMGNYQMVGDVRASRDGVKVF